MELKIEDLKIGEGKEIKKGALVLAHYEGKLDSGSVFDSSYEKGRPFSFVFGTGRVIKGWDLGLVGIREGGRRKLFVPSQLAYGERKIGEMIPPNSNLHFEIEILEIRNRDD